MTMLIGHKRQEMVVALSAWLCCYKLWTGSGVDSLADDVGLLLETSGDLVPHQEDNEDNDDG